MPQAGIGRAVGAGLGAAYERWCGGWVEHATIVLTSHAKSDNRTSPRSRCSSRSRIREGRADAGRDYARVAEDAQHYGGGVREHREEAGARAEPDRVGNLQRDVERALLV